MHATRQPRKGKVWDAACAGHLPALRVESVPWMRTTPLIIGLSALLWEVVLDLAHWLATLPG